MGIEHNVKETIPLKIGLTKVGEIYQYQFHRYEMFAAWTLPDFKIYQFGSIIEIEYMEKLDAFILTAEQEKGYTSILMLPTSRKYLLCVNLINQIYQERKFHLEADGCNLYVQFDNNAQAELIYRIHFSRGKAKILGKMGQIQIPFRPSIGWTGLLPRQIDLVENKNSRFRRAAIGSSFLILK